MKQGTRLTREMRRVDAISTHPFKARIVVVILCYHPLKLCHRCYLSLIGPVWVREAFSLRSRALFIVINVFRLGSRGV